MNKPELISRIAADHGCTKVEAKRIVEYFTETLFDVLAECEPVSLSGFGHFKFIDAAEKQYRNPGTGQLSVAPAKRRVKFVPAAGLAEAVQ